MSEPETPPPVARVAELASMLSETNPAAKGIVRDLFVAFTDVHTHYSRVVAEIADRHLSDANRPDRLRERSALCCQHLDLPQLRDDPGIVPSIPRSR